MAKRIDATDVDMCTPSSHMSYVVTMRTCSTMSVYVASYLEIGPSWNVPSATSRPPTRKSNANSPDSKVSPAPNQASFCSSSANASQTRSTGTG